MGPPKRKAPELSVPRKGDDPAERKRVLNVLAQRRYRQKRKEHVQKLEEANSAGTPEPRPVTSTHDNYSSETSGTQQPGLDTIDGVDFRAFDEAYPPNIFDQIASTSIDLSVAATDAFDQNLAFPDDLQSSAFDTTWDLPSLPASPLSTHSSSLTSLSSPASSSSSSATPYSFPDDRNLGCLELTLLRGTTTVASRIGVLPLIWSLESLSPFALPANAFADYSHLPANLRPTQLQRTMPHHPMIDLLPWPSVRNKLLLVLSLPAELRPGRAATPTALIDFVADIDDSAEGIRLSGEDPCSERNWEIGAQVFKGWWWAFDSAVIAQTNALRKERGAKLLGHGQGAVIGEVS